MKTISLKIKYLIIGFTLLIFILLNFVIGEKLTIFLVETIDELFGLYFAISTNLIDYLLISMIPIAGTLFNTKRKDFKKSELVKDILTIILFTILFFTLGIYLLVYFSDPNPLIPKSVKLEPFNFYITIFLIIGILFPFILSKLIKTKN